MNRRLMIVSTILVLALLALALIATGTPPRADGVTFDRPVLQNAMSGEFANRTLACAGVHRPAPGRGLSAGAMA